MNIPWFTIGAALVVSFTYWVLYYHPTWKTHPSFVYWFVGVSILGTILQARIIKNFNQPEHLIVFGYWWDIAVNVYYLGIPIVLFGAKLNPKQWVGLALVMLGTAIMTYYSN